MGQAFQAYGAAEGPACIYFHGAPGGPQEASWFDAAALTAGVRLLALDRWAVAPGAADDAYFDALAGQVAAEEAMNGGAPVHLIGFSIGAFAALQTAVRLPTPPASLHLVSAAAPLQPGDLERMAGGPVFRIAQRTPGLFSAATALQAVLVAIASEAVLQALFAGAGGAEAARKADPAFRRDVATLLRQSYGPRRAGYVRDVRAYVQPWGGTIGRLRTAPTLWHGTADTWTPPDMAPRISHLCPPEAPVRQVTLPDLAHYSCLFEAAPRIFREIAAGA